ncbi:TPA: hypothetical protein SGV72_000511 [Staphylococcus aureus]|nr:hypothetical protein [Staphylococcus aureus]
MKKNDLLVMSVVYILTSVIMFYINGLSKQFFTYVVGFPIIYFGYIYV